MQRQEYKREDLLAGVKNIDAYTPGDLTTTRMLLTTSSGTAGNPTMLLVQDPEDETLLKHRYGLFKNFCRVVARRQVALQNCMSLLRADHKNRRLLYLEKEDLTDSALLNTVLHEFTPDTLAGSASALSEVFRNQDDTALQVTLPESVQKISLSSEVPEYRVVQKIKSSFPAVDIVSRYSMSESMVSIGSSCPALFDAYFEKERCTAVHPFVPVSIAEPDTDGYGEIVVTTNSMPLYRTGDFGVLVNEQCTCGATQTLLVKTREDKIHCAGATFIQELIENVMHSLKQYVADYEFEVTVADNENIPPSITVRLIATPAFKALEKPNEFIGDYIAQKLYVTKTRTLRELIDEGVFSPIVVEIVTKLNAGPKRRRLRKKYVST